MSWTERAREAIKRHEKTKSIVSTKKELERAERQREAERRYNVGEYGLKMQRKHNKRGCFGAIILIVAASSTVGLAGAALSVLT